MKIQLFIDGLKLFNSPGTQLWPILRRIVVGPYRNLFVVRIFCGNTKPIKVQPYLDYLLTEVSSLLRDGLSVPKCDRSIPIYLMSIIRDTSASSYVKQVE